MTEPTLPPELVDHYDEALQDAMWGYKNYMTSGDLKAVVEELFIEALDDPDFLRLVIERHGVEQEKFCTVHESEGLPRQSVCLFGARDEERCRVLPVYAFPSLESSTASEESS